MNTVIHKYPLAIVTEQLLFLPADAELLSAQMQGDALSLWALVDPSQPPEARKIRVYGTGHLVEDTDDLHYIGTTQMQISGGGALVWHVFEVMAI